MTFQEITENLKQKFGTAIVEVKETVQPDPYIIVDPNSLKEISKYLRDEEILTFDFLNCLSGLDLKGKLAVVYHISSMKHKHSFVLRVEVPTDAPTVPSIESIWKSANWHEREAFDMYGIIFSDHPDLRRILMPYDWEGHPLRKDYQVPEFYNGMKVPY
ncbi:MAG: NADH-quinone oxidoreductase subunit C [Ignavibacteria bacterium]|nr:NADH-quinone oxidoreductase subunit C [Ignavibacteria bacterium]